MRKSPLSTPSDFNRRRPYWSPQATMTRRQPVEIGNECFPANNRQSNSGDDFIPLNMSTPVPSYKRQSGNWYSPGGRSNNAGTSNRGCNYKANYYSTPNKSNSHNQFFAYKNSGRHFQKQGKVSRSGDSRQQSQCRCNFKQIYCILVDKYLYFYLFQNGRHRQLDISQYVDLSSFLEDPWEKLSQKLTKDTSESKISKIESESNLVESTDGSSMGKLDSELQSDTNLSSRYDSKVESSTNVSSMTEDISQISKTDSSDLGISSISFNQTLPSECSSDNSVIKPIEGEDATGTSEEGI